MPRRRPTEATSLVHVGRHPCSVNFGVRRYVAAVLAETCLGLQSGLARPQSKTTVRRRHFDGPPVVCFDVSSRPKPQSAVGLATRLVLVSKTGVGLCIQLDLDNQTYKCSCFRCISDLQTLVSSATELDFHGQTTWRLSMRYESDRQTDAGFISQPLFLSYLEMSCEKQGCLTTKPLASTAFKPATTPQNEVRPVIRRTAGLVLPWLRSPERGRSRVTPHSGECSYREMICCRSPILRMAGANQRFGERRT